MKAKLMMVISSLLLGFLGLILTFIPQEVASSFNFTNSNLFSIVILQILGALYLGFAMLNWMSKNNIIGGIYGKPLIIGNLVHFLVGALALIKITSISEVYFKFILVIAILYSILAFSFGYLMFVNPKKI